MAVPFRLYSVPVDDSPTGEIEPDVYVRLGDLLPLVALAHRNNYLWLKDFLDDEVAITSDLYEVLQNFKCYRPSA